MLLAVMPEVKQYGIVMAEGLVDGICHDHGSGGGQGGIGARVSKEGGGSGGGGEGTGWGRRAL